MDSTVHSERQPNPNNVLVRMPDKQSKPTDEPPSLGSLVAPEKKNKVKLNDGTGNLHQNATAAQDEDDSQGEQDVTLAKGFYTADPERKQWTKENMETVLQNPKPIPPHLLGIYNQSGLKLAFQRLWTNPGHEDALRKLERLDAWRNTGLRGQSLFASRVRLLSKGSVEGMDPLTLRVVLTIEWLTAGQMC